MEPEGELGKFETENAGEEEAEAEIKR